MDETGSLVDDATVAVLLIVEPAGTVGATATVSVKTELPSTDTDGFEHETVPLSPASGVVHDQPAGETSETNVVPAGSVSDSDAVVALDGPEFSAVMV